LKSRSPLTLTLEPEDIHRLASLCGQFDEHLRLIEKSLGVEIRRRGNQFAVYGGKTKTQRAEKVLQELYDDTRHQRHLTPYDVQISLQTTGQLTEDSSRSRQEVDTSTSPEHRIRTKRAAVKPRGVNQQRYVQAIQNHDINFGIGPAGTGKTYLAVACAVEALLSDKVERLLLVRPAVEAGEKLGFLPGDLAQKVDPYLRPLYDALYEMLGFEAVARLLEKQVIEIAPLAYMRGRTLNHAFIILDESQNTTVSQMKMFLTRIGFGSTAVITGDTTQVDLPRGSESGLLHASKVLKGVSGISFTQFTSKDVVRHPLVQQIVDAYDNFDSARNP